MQLLRRCEHAWTTMTITHKVPDCLHAYLLDCLHSSKASPSMFHSMRFPHPTTTFFRLSRPAGRRLHYVCQHDVFTRVPANGDCFHIYKNSRNLCPDEGDEARRRRIQAQLSLIDFVKWDDLVSIRVRSGVTKSNNTMMLRLH